MRAVPPEERNRLPTGELHAGAFPRGHGPVQRVHELQEVAQDGLRRERPRPIRLLARALQAGFGLTQGGARPLHQGRSLRPHLRQLGPRGHQLFAQLPRPDTEPQGRRQSQPGDLVHVSPAPGR